MNPTTSSSDEHQKPYQPSPVNRTQFAMEDSPPDSSDVLIGRASSPVLPVFGFQIDPLKLIPPDPADPSTDYSSDNNNNNSFSLSSVYSDEDENLTLGSLDEDSFLNSPKPDSFLNSPKPDSFLNSPKPDSFLNSPRPGLRLKSKFYRSKSTGTDEEDGERQRAMREAMNGQFKLLVKKFLEVEGILVISQDWVDIVARISWEAGEFVKPDASQGKDMDPWSYVKVKCIACGSRDQSEVIKGLVFKKNMLHKHMPTSFTNPRLLLLKGNLGQSDAGLSSFNSIGEENSHQKESISKMMTTCHPNVIMVEKTVTRDLQELLVKENVSLLLDMKQNRLERIARCTGSPVLSFDEVFKDGCNLGSCKSFRIERFVEEFNDGNKSKTLMYLEGFPKPLGCTILLRGGNSEELKKVKKVLQYAVFAAYHLILETSFFEDQRIFLNDKNTPRDFSSVLSLPSLSIGDSSSQTNPIPNPNPNSNSKPLQKSKELPLLPGFYQVNGSQSMDLYDPNLHLNMNATEEEASKLEIEKNEGAISKFENGEHENGTCVNKTKMEGSESEIDNILILTTSQCVVKQMVCEQSKYNRIKYYGNTDISLGRYLQNIWHSQGQGCLSCGEPPESHEYSYTHKNGNLTVIVKRLKQEHQLSGEKEGKIWMWSLCLKCEGELGISTATPRVVMSTSARSLSFGKFLDLSFSSQSAAKRLSKCGHLLHRDCLRFFGMGAKVAVFWYTPVEVFTACKPPPVLEFHNPYKRGWIKEEFKNVLPRWIKLFAEVETVLKTLRNKQISTPSNEIYNLALLKYLSGAEEMYAKEKADFQVVSENIDNSDKNEEAIPLDIFGLNWLYQDLFLQIFIWDKRLHHLLHYKHENIFSLDISSSSTNGDHVDHPADSTRSEQNPDSNQEHSIENTNQLVKFEKTNSFHSHVNSDKWVWDPFSESKLNFRNEISNSNLKIFHEVNSYKPTQFQISPSKEENKEEKDLVKFLPASYGNIFSVSEDEISSIISYALLSLSETETKLNNHVLNPNLDSNLEKSESLVSQPSSRWSSSRSSSFSDFDLNNNIFLHSQFSNIAEESLPVQLPKERHPEILINDKSGFKLNFKCKYSIVPICFKEFYDLRKKCCHSEVEYLKSMSRCKKWDAQGGKSKAFFAKTLDDRFIIKQIKRAELESFLKFEKDYFKYVNESVDSGNPSGLAKIFGIYQVKQTTKQNKEMKMDLMVMENLLFGRNISRTYDLKGAIFSRHVSDSDSKDSDPVYLDQNFIDDLRLAPFYVGVKTKHVLQRAIWNDTSFLTNINVMDYSLLVGVDKQKHELVFGIIDYLRQFTWDKQLETWVKSSLVVPKNTLPTVISPKEYKKRFRHFMIKYFLTVPDSWTFQPVEKCVGPCKFCQKKISDKNTLQISEENISH